MDFFEHQEVARRKTGRLVLLFALAVAGIVVLTYLAVVVTLGLAQTRGQGLDPAGLFDWRLLLGVGAGVATVVSLGSLYRISQLSAGGTAVADLLGGRRIATNTAQADERKLLNVVEEMALASGTPVPAVYVMYDEQGINAFAAGHSPEDAVIGVTRGCMERLSRDELQGVIAHEFSHVLNGDMKLNLRLMGVVHGILVIGLLGHMILRSGFYAPRRSRRSEGKGAGGILALGAALAVIGFVGTFFGNLIKAAVSRQREFLADASAVQFTRNPLGIAGALKKIGGLVHGSRLSNAHAMEVSHMLFGMGFTSWMGSMLATHPPLEQRIRRIEPRFDGKYPVVPDARGREEAHQPKGPTEEERREAALTAAAAVVAATPDGASALDRIGQPTPEHVLRAREILERLPATLSAAAREPYGARGLVYALLLDADAALRGTQLARVEGSGDLAGAKSALELYASCRELGAGERLVLLDLAAPALRTFSPRQFQAFERCVTELIHADDEVDLSEWILQRLALDHVRPHFEAEKRAVHYDSLAKLGAPVSLVLSALARAGHETEDQAPAAIERAGAVLPEVEVTLMPEPELDALSAALGELDRASAPKKKQLLTACAACIAADLEVTDTEAELFRAIAAALHCPVPPVLPGQKLA
jgi:Zn-dependent protease with chaperone function